MTRDRDWLLNAAVRAVHGLDRLVCADHELAEYYVRSAVRCLDRADQEPDRAVWWLEESQGYIRKANWYLAGRPKQEPA